MHTAPRHRFLLICLLGSLSVISPFSIDMYLPAFPQMAHDMNVSSAVVSLSLSVYFVGLALGQIFYGPFLDRFGRKRPIYFGLSLFILSSLGCFYAGDMHTLLLFRFLQAIGGCAAQVGATAMVRDFFPVKESARMYSLLFLFIGVSPLCAPSVGSLVVLVIGWKMIFLLLGGLVSLILALTVFFLPEGHEPDAGISLKPLPIIREFIAILKHPRFFVYALAGAFSFAGLFAYVAGSPIIFMDGYHLSAQAYGGVFAVLTLGFIGGAQVNVALLKRFTSETIFARALLFQAATGLVFVLGAWLGWWGFVSTLLFFFVFLSCAGLTSPNSAALALEPFTRNTGSASSLLGFLQLGIGAVISTGISVTVSGSGLPIIAILAATAITGLVIFYTGYGKARVLTPES